ncbi:MAG: hypothetical protein KDI44_02590 [Thiothrix sp.]|nr:hypothetical protein [Thiothrix sp.]HPQ94183.1 hypothetical protein [Thiolinea sp.]
MKALNFRQLVSDIAAQDGRWREVAQKAADYYDHLQVTDGRRRDVERSCGGVALIGNLIQPAINSVLGHEEQRRVQWMLVADDEDSEEVAEGLNQRLNETARLCYANRYCSDAYKDQVIKGVGWLYMERNPDPFGTPYLIEQVPVSEIWWDMRSRDPGLRDCRWVARRKFMDRDEALAFFPGQGAIIDQVCSHGWGDYSGFQIGDAASMAEWELRQAEWSSASRYASHLYQDSSERRRVAVYQVFYRVFQSVRALRFADGRVEEWDRSNLMHAVALAMRMAGPVTGVAGKMRCKWYIGPHEISDEASPHPHNHYPFVPFWGYRKDGANTPYGLVEGMIDPQDAYNEVGFRIHQIIKHKRVFFDPKALSASGMTASDLVHELNREDGAIPTDTSDGIRVEQDWAKLQALRGERELHAQQIRDFSGIYHSYSGQVANTQSGIAIASAAELGATTLSEINANYQFGRKRLGELILAHLVEDIGDQQVTVRVRSQGAGAVKRTVILNGPRRDGQGTNAVTRARLQVALADVASSAGYRQHTHMRVMEMFQVAGNDPVMAPFLLELAVDTSELPNREEILEKWRKQRGMSDDPDEQEAMRQQAQQAARQLAQLEQAKAQAVIAENQAQAEREQAHAAYYTAQAAETIARTEALQRQAEMEAAQARAAQLVAQRRAEADERMAAV